MAKSLKACVSVKNKMEESFNALQIAYELNINDALSNMIGVPNKKASNYKMHKILYDNMKNYFLKWGGATAYEADPWDMVGKWATYFSRLNLNPIYRGNDTLPSRTLHGMNKRFEKIRKKSDEIMARPDQRMKNWERALMPPGLLMMKADRFGTVSKLIDAAQAITDKTVQSYQSYIERMKIQKEGFEGNFTELVGSGQVDLDNPIDGISGLFDSDGENVTILKRIKTTKGTTKYRVSYDNQKDDDGRNIEKTIPESKLGYAGKTNFFSNIGRKIFNSDKYQKFDDVLYESLVMEKYRDEFTNDIVHGQTRYFIPTTTENTSQRDNRIITYALERRKARTDFLNKKDPDAPPEFQNENIDMQGKYETPDLSVAEFKSADPEIQLSPDGLVEYLMVKQETPRNGAETYKVYALRSKKDATSEWENVAHQADNIDIHILKEGFYKAQKEHSYSYLQGKGEVKYGRETKQYYIKEKIKNSKNDIKFQPHKAYGAFQYLENQPSDAVLTKTIAGTGGITLWDLVAEYREQYRDLYEDVRKFGKANDKTSVRLRKTISNEMKRKINPETKKQYTAGEIADWIDDNILKLGGIESAVYEGKYGLSTSDSYFQKIGVNYGPVMFTRQALENMMDDAVENINKKLAGDLHPWARKRLEPARDGINKILEMLVSRGIGEQSRDIRDAASTVHTEHRSLWTSNLNRRKDGNVHAEYLEKTFRNLHRNSLVNQMVSTMYTLSKTESMMPTDITDYMVNRVKLALGHIDTINKVPTLRGWQDVSQEEVAAWMNTWFPKSLRAGREFDEASAEKLMLIINGLFSGRFLGMGGAMGNRTQILNPIIHYGLDIWKKAGNALNGGTETSQAKWKSVVDATGVLNLISMFNEIMLGSGEHLDGHDFGLYPFSDRVSKWIGGAAIPIPSQNMRNWFSLIRRGKDNFLKNGESSIDHLLLNMLFREKSKLKKAEISYLRELTETLKRLDTHQKWSAEFNADNLSDELKTELLDKRDAYWGLLTIEEANNKRDLVEKRMRRLVGEISDHKFKKMVTWKLSWWFTEGNKDLFTFTEGEQQMRSETALMAIFHAQSLGLLGKVTTGDYNDSMYKSPIAKKVARDAVYQMMFGMSPVWLGEAFSGMGRTVMQYKSYTLFQMIHDRNIAANFMDSSYDTKDAFVRIFTALGENSTDIEAKAFVRLLMSRGVASTFGVMSSIAPIMWKIIGRSSGATKIIRSAENPVFALAARMVVWAVMLGMGFSEEDEEKARDDWGNRLMFMFLPVLFGSLFRDAYDSITNFTD
jgi:hypothetical protein